MRRSETLTWKSFITGVNNDRVANNVPVRSQTQVDQKYTDGHKLQALLGSHQDALRRDPRDKVYGFMASQVTPSKGFP